MVDEYEPETNTVYQFHGCHWHGHTCLRNCTKKQQKRYEDTCQIDWFIENNGEIQNIILCLPGNVKNQYYKKVRLEKEFMPYPHFRMYDFEAILALLNEHPTDNLTYLSRHIPISVAVHDTLSKEPVYFLKTQST